MQFLFMILGYGVSIAIGYFVEQAKGGPKARFMDAGIFHKIFQKGFGILLFIGIIGVVLTQNVGLAAAFVGPLYVTYLLWPGYRGFFFDI